MELTKSDKIKRRGGIIGKINRRHPALKLVVGLLVVLGGIGISLPIDWTQPVSLDFWTENNNGAPQDGVRKVEEPDLVAERDAKRAAEKQQTQQLDVIESGDTTGKKLVALTFDDGPEPQKTDKILDILREKEALATFFVVGNNLQKYPELVQRAEREGHEVESHSLGHQDLSKMTAVEMTNDMDEMNRIFNTVLGHGPTLLRPPYGAVSQTMRDVVKVPMMVWSVDSMDWKTLEKDAVTETVMNTVFDGAVILMHDLYDTTVEAVPVIIERLRAQGYELVTVADLASKREASLDLGVLYGNFKLD